LTSWSLMLGSGWFEWEKRVALYCSMRSSAEITRDRSASLALQQQEQTELNLPFASNLYGPRRNEKSLGLVRLPMLTRARSLQITAFAVWMEIALRTFYGNTWGSVCIAACRMLILTVVCIVTGKNTPTRFVHQKWGTLRMLFYVTRRCMMFIGHALLSVAEVSGRNVLAEAMAMHAVRVAAPAQGSRDLVGPAGPITDPKPSGRGADREASKYLWWERCETCPE
jgi:hypothetical protein